MTIGIGTFAFDLALPFETGGMDASGFTVAPGTAQGRRAGLSAARVDGQGSSWGSCASCLSTLMWIGAALVR